jgi:hypothetical protein
MKKASFLLITLLFTLNTNAETIQCVNILLKSKQYSNNVLSEMKKTNPNFCIIADNLEQQLNWLGSADKYCTDKFSIDAAHGVIRKLSPMLLNATIKCGH